MQVTPKTVELKYPTHRTFLETLEKYHQTETEERYTDFMRYGVDKFRWFDGYDYWDITIRKGF